MNILVVGRGWVGRKMFDQLVVNGHVVTLSPHEKAIDEIRGLGRYDWVVNCAGITGSPNVDACEWNKAKTYEGNVEFPLALYNACKDYGIPLAHFSSGCIYQGQIDDIGADPNFFGSTYSVSKGITDVLLKNKPNTLLFRVRLPFDSSRNPKNLLEKLCNYSKSGKLIEGGENSITDIDEAVKTAAELIDKDVRGIYNLVQWGSITTKRIADMMGLNAEWFTPDEFAQVTFAKRSNCVIPAYERMTPVEISLEKAIVKFKDKL